MHPVISKTCRIIAIAVLAAGVLTACGDSSGSGGGGKPSPGASKPAGGGGY